MACIVLTKIRTTLVVAGLWLVESVGSAQIARLPETGALRLPDKIVQVQLRQVTDFFQRQIVRAQKIRDQQWALDASSLNGYQESLRPHRENLRRMLGVKQPILQLDRVSISSRGLESGCRVERVVIPTELGLSARGVLFLPPASGQRPLVIVCSDAESWPERWASRGEKGSPSAWLLDLLRRNVAVFVPQSIERLLDHPYCRQTTDKDRRWVLYRLGFCVGHSMPGLDVQDVSAVVEYLAQRDDIDAARIGLVGVGDGGMTALLTAALMPRVAAVGIVDYFENRDHCWREPFDRRIRDRLREFGDAELAAMIAPRPLVLATSSGFAEYAHDLAKEVSRAAYFYARLNVADQLNVLSVAASPLRATLIEVANELKVDSKTENGLAIETAVAADETLPHRNAHFEERLVYLRKLIDQSEAKRYAKWQILKRPPEDRRAIQERMLADYRQLVGEVPSDGTSLNPCSELALTTPEYDLYRITLDVVEGVQVYGNLMVPTGINEPRPAVICQHGLTGMPEMITGLGMTKDTVYHEFGRKLAERGYVVFAPLLLHHNPVQQITDQTRQAGAVGMMRIAMCIAKTERVLDFLQSQPFVNDDRIGYYGLSYGGYSAIWMSPLLDRITLSVVSGNFNDRRRKLTYDGGRPSYLLHPSEDMYNWNILHRFTHPELIAMLSTRPCCIEYGTQDTITNPEWTANAWKQVDAIRRHWRLGDRIVLAQFDGGHEVPAGEAFDVVDRWLWPDRQASRH